MPTTIQIQANAINVTAYGAVGNGVTDDTAAIQAAANAAAAKGLQLYFPPGTYNVSSALHMPSNVVWIATPGTAKMVATKGNAIITSVETTRDVISGLTLAGSTSGTSVPSALLIVYRAAGFTLADATIEHTTGIGALFSDVNGTNVYGSTFDNIGNNANLALSAQGAAFTNDIAGYGNNNVVQDSNFTAIGLDAISATGQMGFSAISNKITGGPMNYGWQKMPAAAAGVYGNEDTQLVVRDNTIQGVSGNGVDVDNSVDVKIYLNTISDTGSAGIGLFSSQNGAVNWNTTTNNDVLHHFQAVGGITIGGFNAKDIEIAGNVSGNTGSGSTQPYGIQILDSQDMRPGSLVIRQNNTLMGNTVAGVYNPHLN
jgi:polygalacturonase